jgi:tetratricopeptide (TPR) repeat protein
MTRRASNTNQAAELFGQAAHALQSRRLPEAEALFRRVVGADPSNAEAHNWLGVVCQQLGKGEEALDQLRTAVSLAPFSADFVNNLGITELKLEHFEAARRSFEIAIRLNPRLAQGHYNLGLALRKLGDHERAIACFRQAISLVPNYANAYLSLGNALSDMGQHEEAIAVLRQLVAMAPKVPAPLYNLATALSAAQRYDEAADVAHQILAIDPKSAVAHEVIAAFLWNAERFEEAEQAARRVVVLSPENARAHVMLGRALNALGRFDEAIETFETALRLKADNAEALYGLTGASKAYSNPEFAARVKAALTADPGPDDAALLHFALGKIYDDMKDYPRAFENYERANELSGAKASPFLPEKWDETLDRVIAVFTPEFFAARRDFGSDSLRPVFIFGMPRSGTTLVEQIVAVHPKAAAGGEMLSIPRLAAEVNRRIGTTAYPEAVAEMDNAAAHSLAAAYLADLDRVSRTAQRVTDKLPFNYLYVGFLALLFPKAAFIHCRRDPIDTCLSCFFTNFHEHVNFGFRLEHIGAYYRSYRRLMDHWRKVLPIPMLEVDYEDLIANQEPVTRRIVAHCGLEWDDECLAFHQSGRAVTTASVWQVRQPIYQASRARWRHYEPFLGPLRAALEDSGS